MAVAAEVQGAAAFAADVDAAGGAGGRRGRAGVDCGTAGRGDHDDGHRVVDERAKGVPATAFGNLARFTVVQADHAVSDFMLEYMPGGMLGDDPMQQAHHQRAIAAGIASGAAKIQLNLAARRFLDLPSETARGL